MTRQSEGVADVKERATSHNVRYTISVRPLPTEVPTRLRGGIAKLGSRRIMRHFLSLAARCALDPYSQDVTSATRFANHIALDCVPAGRDFVVDLKNTVVALRASDNSRRIRGENPPGLQPLPGCTRHWPNNAS